MKTLDSLVERALSRRTFVAGAGAVADIEGEILRRRHQAQRRHHRGNGQVQPAHEDDEDLAYDHDSKRRELDQHVHDVVAAQERGRKQSRRDYEDSEKDKDAVSAGRVERKIARERKPF